MICHKYGTFSDNQVQSTKTFLRKQIYYLLLYVDPKTNNEYKNVDVPKAFDSLLTKIGGLNKILFEPPEIVTVLSLLESALTEYLSPDFNYSAYRKLILDAGNEVLKIKEE